MAADSKTIDQLPTKETLNAGDMFPVDDGEQTYKVLLSAIINNIPGIVSVVKSQDGQSLVVTDRAGQSVTITIHDNTKQDVLTFDNVPTQNSSNPVKSGGVYAADADLAAAILQEAQTARESEGALQGRMSTAEGNISSLGTAVDTINNTSLPAKMDKSVYDSNGDGVVDNAKKVNNHTVEKDVPSNAVFTDTVYDDTELRNKIGDMGELETEDKQSLVGAVNEVYDKIDDLVVANQELEEFHGSQTILDSNGDPILDSSNARILDTSYGATGVVNTLNNIVSWFKNSLSHLIQDSGYTETQELYEILNS